MTTIELPRLNLKDPSKVGFLQRWYGYKRPGLGVIWTDTPEVRRAADLTRIVETFGPDPLLVRYALMIGEGL